MSDVNDLLVEALRARQDECPASDGSPLLFHWNGNDYPVCAGAETDSKILGLGGWATDADLIVIIAMADFGDGPQPDRKQTGFYPGADGTRYRIDKTTVPPGSPFLALALMDPTNGA